MARAIIDFLDDPVKHKSMVLKGKKVVEECFDFKIRTLKLEKIYSEIMKGIKVS